MEPAYAFRPVTRDDLLLLQAWLGRPHVREWWGDPAAALDEIDSAMDDPGIELFMVTHEDSCIGYLQSWNPHADPGHPCRDQLQGTRGIDQFIGEPDLVARGHGSAFIRLFVQRLLAAGAPRVITDPNPSNQRAIRAYMKAGFVPVGNMITLSGDALLMSCEA